VQEQAAPRASAPAGFFAGALGAWGFGAAFLRLLLCRLFRRLRLHHFFFLRAGAAFFFPDFFFAFRFFAMIVLPILSAGLE